MKAGVSNIDKSILANYRISEKFSKSPIDKSTAKILLFTESLGFISFSKRSGDLVLLFHSSITSAVNFGKNQNTLHVLFVLLDLVQIHFFPLNKKKWEWECFHCNKKQQFIYNTSSDVFFLKQTFSVYISSLLLFISSFKTSVIEKKCLLGKNIHYRKNFL